VTNAISCGGGGEEWVDRKHGSISYQLTLISEIQYLGYHPSAVKSYKEALRRKPVGIQK